MKYLAIVTASLFTIASSSAFACNLKNLPFGQPTHSVVNNYKLDMDFEGGKGQNIIMTKSLYGCTDFPTGAEVGFVFINKKFVQLVIEKIDSKDTLFKYALRILGDPDKKPYETDSGVKKDIEFFNTTWDSKNNVVTYIVRGHNGKSAEYLSFSSKKHNKLIDKYHNNTESDGR